MSITYNYLPTFLLGRASITLTHLSVGVGDGIGTTGLGVGSPRPPASRSIASIEEERQEVTDAETAAAGADELTCRAVAALGTDALNELEERRLRLMMG